MKVCFKCNTEKPIDSFYKHKMMKDGHLNKCIECAKMDSDKRFKENLKDSDWVAKERKRNRIRMRGKHRVTSKQKNTNKLYFERFPEKRNATIASASIIVPDGFQKHHWSYNDKHYRDVIFLIPSHHSKAHRFIIYDSERKMYRRFDNNHLLDSKEKHEAFVKEMILTQED